MKKKALIMLGLAFLLMMPSGAWLLGSSLSGPPPNEIQSDISKEKADKQPEIHTAATKKDSSGADEENPAFEQDIQEAVAAVVNEPRSLFLPSDYNITAIGDSLTQGVGDSTDNGGYIGILEQSMENEETNGSVSIKNYGKRGNRSDQILERLDKPNISSSIKNSDMILLTVGANDIMKIVRGNVTNLTYEAFAEEKGAYETRLRMIFNTIRDTNEEAPIYLIGIYNPFNMYFSNIPELNQIVGDWNEIGKEVTEDQENASFIPIQDIFQYAGEGYFSKDNFHPNRRGYASIADRVLDYIEPDIKESQDDTDTDEENQDEE